jgi:hypothetical protein
MKHFIKYGVLFNWLINYYLFMKRSASCNDNYCHVYRVTVDGVWVSNKIIYGHPFCGCCLCITVCNKVIL